MKFLNKALLGVVAAVGFLAVTTTPAEARHYHYYRGGYHPYVYSNYGYYRRPYVVYDDGPYYGNPYYYGPGGVSIAFGGGRYYHGRHWHRR